MSQLSSLFSPSDTSEPLTSSLFQPKPRKPPVNQPSQMTQDNKLVVANTTVSLFYFNHQTNQYDNYGNTGLCIIMQNNQFSLLLYRSNEDHISETRITKDFKFFIQSGNYGSFYDLENRLVSCLFSSERDAQDFAKKIAIVKYVAGGRQSVVYVDLNEGKGEALKSNDRIGVKYTGMFLVDTQPLPSMGQQFDSNRDSSTALLSFKIGHGKVVKGMDEGVLGMKMNGNASRLIIVPAQYAYGERGAPPQIPPNSTLCFIVDVVKAKKPSNSGAAVQSETSSQKNVDSRSESDSLSLHNGDDLGNGGVVSGSFLMTHPPGLHMLPVNKQNVFSPLSEPQSVVSSQLHSPHDLPQFQPLDSPSSQSLNTQKSKKSSNGKRSKKGGKKGGRRTKGKKTVYSDSDSDAQDESASDVSSDASSDDKRTKSRRSKSAGKRQQKHSDTESSYSSDDSDSTSDERSSSRRRTRSGKVAGGKKSKKSVISKQEATLPPKASAKLSTPDTSASLLARLQSIEEKIDGLDLSDLLRTKDANRKMIYMSGPVLMQNMQHIISENESLRNDLAEEKEKVDKLVERMRDLKERNNSLTKHSFTFTQDDDFLQGELMSAKKQVKNQQATILQMTEQIEQLTTERNALKEQNASLTDSLDEAQQSKMYFEAKVGNLESDIGKLNQKLREMLEQIEHSKNHNATLTDENHAQSEEINRLQNKLAAEIKARDNTQEQLKESQQTIRELLEDREEKSATIDELKQKLRELVAQINQEREEQEEELEQLKTQYEIQQSELKDKFMAKLAEVRAEGEEETAEQSSSAVKMVMKQIYGNVTERIPHPERRYRGAKLLNVLLEEVKGLTQQFLQHIDAGEEVESFEYDADEHDELSDDEPSEEEQKLMGARFAPAPVVKESPPVQQNQEPGDEPEQSEEDEIENDIQVEDEEDDTHPVPEADLPPIDEGEEEDIAAEQEQEYQDEEEIVETPDAPLVVTETDDTQLTSPEDDLYVNSDKDAADDELANESGAPAAFSIEDGETTPEQPTQDEAEEADEEPANPAIEAADPLSSGAIVEEVVTEVVEEEEEVVPEEEDPLFSLPSNGANVSENVEQEEQEEEEDPTIVAEPQDEEEEQEEQEEDTAKTSDVVKDTASEDAVSDDGHAGLVGGEDSEGDYEDTQEENNVEDEAAQQDILADFDDAQKEEEDTAKGSTIEASSSFYDRPMTTEEREKKSAAASSLFSDLDDDDFF